MFRSELHYLSHNAALLAAMAIALYPVTATGQSLPVIENREPQAIATSTLAEQTPKSKPLIAFRRSDAKKDPTVRPPVPMASTALHEAPVQNKTHSQNDVLPQATLQQDAAVFPATHTAEAHEEAETPRFELDNTQAVDPRRLAPPTRLGADLGTSNFQATNPDTLPFAIPQIESLTTAGAGLAIVVGLFLLCMWLLRRSGPKPTTPLPTEAVAVLGRVPLAARHFAHLLQVGNKLVLVSVTADGVDPITEITEPAEVDRLLGLCLRNHKHSSTAEFQQVLQQLAREPAQGFLGKR